MSEIDKYCSKFIEEKYGNTLFKKKEGFKNYGDFNEWTWWHEVTSKWYYIHHIIGGTPCQSFSVIGKRRGEDDVRADLTREFARFVCGWRAPRAYPHSTWTKVGVCV